MPLQKNHLSLLGYEYVYLNIQEPLRFKYNMQNIFYVLGKCLPCKNFFQKKKKAYKKTHEVDTHLHFSIHTLATLFPFSPTKGISTQQNTFEFIEYTDDACPFLLKIVQDRKKKLRKVGDFYNCNCTAGMQCLRVGGG